MDILENELEDIIYQMFQDKSHLLSEIQCSSGKVLRQVNLKGYGRMDLVNISHSCSIGNGNKKIRYWNIDVIELKRGKISFTELGQLCRYMKGVRRYIKSLEVSDKNHFIVNGILIGKGIETNGDFVYLLDYMEDINCYTVSLDYKTGLSFNSCKDQYYSANEDFGDIHWEYYRDILIEVYNK